MQKLVIATFLVTALVTLPVYAAEKASEQRLDEVVARGVKVMPFSLEQTTHIFSKTAQGGIQQVIVKEANNIEQIKHIRQHLAKISAEFKKCDFSNPAKIHGDAMPGLKQLQLAKPGQIEIVYKELAKGAQITYSTSVPELKTAIHQWFDAQLTDHARHATSEHSNHLMHQPENIDKRQTLTITELQRGHVLAEMRALLAGTQAILTALSNDDMNAVAQSAKPLGMGMAHKAEDQLKGALPKTFMQLGMTVHQDFDQIAASAESTKDSQQVLRQLSQAMGKCVACHATYQIRTVQ